MKESKILPLNSLNLRSRPFAKRAISWSGDAELAVAADDSVWIFVPEFPKLDFNGSDLKGDKGSQDGTANGATISNDDGPPLASASESAASKGMRAQFSDGQRRIPISTPRVEPGVNSHLFYAARLPSPYDRCISYNSSHGGSGFDRDSMGVGGVNRDDEDATNFVRNPRDRNNPFRIAGAGSGTFSSVGASLNQVISLAWSPPIGRNTRPVLAVLSGAGYVAVYGERCGEGHGKSSSSSNERARARLGDLYDTQAWEILWAVGERMAVPPQTEWGECVSSFAWSHEVGDGRVLLALETDQSEVVVLAIQGPASTAALAPMNAGEEAEEAEDEDDDHPSDQSAGWRIEEVARFDAAGPHPPGTLQDPDFVPCSSSFGLSFGPWVTTEGQKTCLLSYVARNYIGFRKITVKTQGWFEQGKGFLEVAEKDFFGRCLFLSTDAFVAFEDTILEPHGSKTCRGVIATPMIPKVFEVSLSGPPNPVAPHRIIDCRTTYPSAEDIHTNPIQDVLVHPPNFAKPTDHPIYTLIRMSATQTVTDWYQTNAPLLPNPPRNSDPRPKWAIEIANKLEISVPATMGTRKLGADGLADDDDEDEAEEEDDDDDDDSTDGTEEDAAVDLLSQDENPAAAAAEDPTAPAPSTPSRARKPSRLRQVQASSSSDVPLYRMRLFGLAASPGRGASAVVWATLSSTAMERGAWHQARSVVSFDCSDPPQLPPPPLALALGGRGAERAGAAPAAVPVVAGGRRLSTEGRMWEWMYGGGPGVAGITEPLVGGADGDGGGGAAVGIRILFEELVKAAKCDFCQTPLSRVGIQFVCANNHMFEICGLSGVPIQEPGISRVCGVCATRSLNADKLAGYLPEKATEINRAVSATDRCGRCGGKFLD